MQGIILRSKDDWYEHEEKSSKHFLHLEKKNKSKSHIRKILNSDSVELSEPETILSDIMSFYSMLYKKRNDKTETEWEIIKVQAMMVSPKNFMFVSLKKSTHIYCKL